MGHSFTLGRFLSFLLQTAHYYFPDKGLSELLEKIEFSKGTEQARAQGLRISFITSPSGNLSGSHHAEDRKAGGEQSSGRLGSSASLTPKLEGFTAEAGLSRGFALKLNKYLGSLEKVF